MKSTTQSSSYMAKQLNASEKNQLAISAIRREQSISKLANTHNVSRQFIHRQQAKALNAINDAFTPTVENEKVLFYLPVTLSWLCQLVLCLLLHCRASHRGIQKVLLDAFDHRMSLGTIHSVVNKAKIGAKAINAKQDLTRVKLAAQDEMFHQNKPILTGVDITSLYCYLLSHEADRDTDTWTIHLLDLQQQGFNPDGVFGDDAKAIQAAHHAVFPNTPYYLDHFHAIRDMKTVCRYVKNRLKRTISHRNTLEKKVAKRYYTETMKDYTEPLEAAIETEAFLTDLSRTLTTLTDWMQRDVLEKAGLAPDARAHLFDCIHSAVYSG